MKHACKKPNRWKHVRGVVEYLASLGASAIEVTTTRMRLRITWAIRALQFRVALARSARGNAIGGACKAIHHKLRLAGVPTPLEARPC